MSDPALCSRCGHDRVFHRLGTGNGVPIGKQFCDDRHADPCDCGGFVAPSVILMTGSWRVSFNRHGVKPRVWSIMQDDPGMRWELAVSHLSITAPCWTRYEPKATADDDDGLPSAWIGVTGMLRVLADGTATIT